MKKFLFITLAVLIVGVALYMLICNYTYSEGSRTGYLVKFNVKGYIFKTYEGELNLGGMNAENNSVANYLWDFSVLRSDQGAIDSLKAYEGNVIKIYYRGKIKNMPWQGDTPFFVYKVEVTHR